MPAFDGHLLVQLHLRRAQRAADKPTADAIGKALADSTFVDDAVASVLSRSEAMVTGGGFLAFLQLLLANLPGIIQLIMQLFGGLVPPAPKLELAPGTAA